MFKHLLRYLNHKHSIKSIYYPGAGHDFESMCLFMNSTDLETVYYVDYHANRIDQETIRLRLPRDWEITEEINIEATYFGKNSWDDYWYNLDSAVQISNPQNAYGSRFLLSNSAGRQLVLYYLGTEAIKTYQILIDQELKPDVIVLQDHGLGGAWGHETFGYNEHKTGNKFYGLSKVTKSLPYLLLVGENTNPWPEYLQLTEFEKKEEYTGHRKALFALK